MDDEALKLKEEQERIAEQQKFERKRQGERGGPDLLRGGPDLLRGALELLLRGGPDLLRGGPDLLRGGPDLLRGMGFQVASDIFRAAAGLGGHLIVALVAPISGSSGTIGYAPPAAAPLTAAILAAKAQAELSKTPQGTRPTVSGSDTSTQPPPSTNKE